MDIAILWRRGLWFILILILATIFTELYNERKHTVKLKTEAPTYTQLSSIQNHRNINKYYNQLIRSNKSCLESELYVSHLRGTNRSSHITFSGSFQCLLLGLNTVLNTARSEEKDLGDKFVDLWLNLNGTDDAAASENPKHGRTKEYFKTISSFPQIRTIAIEWLSYKEKDWDSCSLPVKEFFFSAAFPPETECYDSSELHLTCQNNINMNFVRSGSFEGPWKHQKSNLPERNDFQLYIHIVHNAKVDINGTVKTGNLSIIPFQCSIENFVADNVTDAVVYEEVFTIAQFWGEAFFHANIEDMPRLGPFVDFLLVNPQIYIHVASISIIQTTMEIFGIEKHRLLEGNIRAKLLYLPPGGGCGWFRPLPGLALSQRYQQYIKSSPRHEREHNVIILIKRSTKRWLVQHYEIASYLRRQAQKYNMEFWVFHDDPLPALNVIMEMFHRARLIVAPHGAGLANTVFTSPGATIIEVLCNPFPNACYYDTVETLGHAYIGLLSEPGPCEPMMIDLGYLKKVIDSVLNSVHF